MNVVNRKWYRLLRLSLFSLLGSLLLWVVTATPSQSHWADLTVAEIRVAETQAQITLTFPTGLLASADDNQDNQLSPSEVAKHQSEIERFLSDRIRLTDSQRQTSTLKVQPADTTTLPSNLQATAGTHSTLLLTYSWLRPIQGLKIYYDLFLPGVPTARCLATIFHQGQVQNAIFSPENRESALIQGSPWQLAASVPIAIAGAFLWGAMHALTPGHGKTIVGAYLVGSRATVQHALFLGLTTTIAHTTGIFALGLVALFASQFILPEQLYPWLSAISGLIVVGLGLNLFFSRMRGNQWFSRWSSRRSQKSAHHHLHGHADEHHPHSHAHEHHLHSHQHEHEAHLDTHSHSHGGHTHSHLPLGADGTPVTWRNLLALGISGGLLPCPSALVLLLSAIALGRVGFGIVLVLAFSLGLAGVLTGLGLLLVCTKRLFKGLPVQTQLAKVLPALGALGIALLGAVITVRAVMQIGLVTT
ncbi:sulfite exporter TauE/SafE family protein [Trichocoleus sp. FACHB-591]|uniref:nickel/cobalt transporter n=2 Tax=Trichocoleus TaxID=450526 RepID=UPI0016822548|nr:sulfite exporter TauE/SafE family protein [Trichocoleus sp. FACHB-591]MBD2093655.1 sulfite exporter TauE/SafE family protein [Trichocoleus sp. FACHB-591]